MTQNMQGVKHILLVLSGKGGVGKSTVSSQLAFLLMKQGKKVGLLDIDLTGPSIPKIVGLEKHNVHQSSQGWVPVYLDEQKRLACMSIGFLLEDKDSAVVWRGPKKNAIIKQFLEDVCWGDLDYLVIDTPPGTSDEHITVAEQLTKYHVDGAVVVTTPQGVSTSDVRREISFCRKVGFPILGLVENMSGFVCPTCKECTLIFSKGGGELLAKEQQIPFIGCVPIDPAIAQSCDEGKSFIDRFATSESLLALEKFARELVAGKNTTAPHHH